MKNAIFKSCNIFFTTDLVFLLKNEKFIKHTRQHFSCDPWLDFEVYWSKVQNFQNPELSKLQSKNLLYAH